MKSLIWVLALGLVMSVYSYAVVDEDLETGLVGYWRLDGDGRDSAGFGNHGIVHGSPEVVDGMVGKAFSFDGIDDGVEIPSNETVELPEALTAACWVFPRSTRDATGTDHAGIFWKGNKIGWGANFNWRIATAGDSGITWGSTGGGVEGYFATGNALADGLEQWYHLVLTEDGSEGRAYVNGVEMTDDDVTGGDMHRPAAPYDTWPDEPIRIGWSQGQGGDVDKLVYFDGIIDDVVLYSRALNGAEVRMLMEQGVPSTAVESAGKLTTTWSGLKAQ